MNPIKLYTVKEAAKLIGVSTNTLYKYLDEGRIKAARGAAVQGRFRIPESALEEFLGISLSSQPNSEPSTKLTQPSEVGSLSTNDQVLEDPKPVIPDNVSLTSTHLPQKIARLLLLLGLSAMLIDIIISPTTSPSSVISRTLLFICFLLLAYQEGGFRRRNT